MKLLNLLNMDSVTGLVLKYETEFIKDPDSIIKAIMAEWNLDHTKLPVKEFDTIKQLCTMIFCKVKKHVGSI
jgi:hypothetical protein